MYRNIFSVMVSACVLREVVECVVKFNTFHNGKYGKCERSVCFISVLYIEICIEWMGKI